MKKEAIRNRASGGFIGEDACQVGCHASWYQHDDDALAHSGVCLLRRCDAVLRRPGMERALSLPAADNDREGSSPVARRASSRALQSLARNEVGRWGLVWWPQLPVSSPTATSLSRANADFHAPQSRSELIPGPPQVTPNPGAEYQERLTTYRSFQSLLQTLSSWRELRGKPHSGFTSLPSITGRKTGFLPLGVSTLAQTNGPWRANFKCACRKCASSRIAEQPRLRLCRTELWWSELHQSGLYLFFWRLLAARCARANFLHLFYFRGYTLTAQSRPKYISRRCRRGDHFLMLHRSSL